METVMGVILLLLLVAFIVAKIHDKRAGIVSPRERAEREAATARMERQRRMVCPHCQQAGSVTARPVKVKRGIGGGKATGAVLTAGFSLLATGLSRKERVTAAHCGNCGADWTF